MALAATIAVSKTILLATAIQIDRTKGEETVYGTKGTQEDLLHVLTILKPHARLLTQSMHDSNQATAQQ